MLAESLVRWTLGLKDHRVVGAENDGMGITVELASKRGRRLACSGCGERVPRDDTLWTHKKRGWAGRHLRRWFWWATHSRLQPIRDFAWMLRGHEEGVLAWFQVPINNGATEAMNDKTKVVGHRSHGQRTEESFTLSLLHCLGNLPLPQTTHRFL